MASAFVVAEPRSRLARLLPAGLVALAWILIAVHAWVLLAAAWPFTTDDAWITLRYARNLAAGEGVTWNAGDPPVEGYSNFLYVVIGAAALRLGLGLPELLKILGTGFLAVALAAQFVLCRRRAGDPIGVVPSVVFLSYWSVPLWTVSGLETPAYVAFSMLAFVALDRWRAEAVESGAPSRRADLRALGAGLWILLAALTRPEGPLVGIALAAGLLLGRRSRAAGDGEPAPGAGARWRGFALMLVTSALPYGFYAAWKLVHFGSLLPNSVRCKALYPGDPFQLPGDAL
ncbi:MAG TPA: hypothetical protein VLA66_05910, partial [Thermoanaerobaculia bacterium]|nr:hypothetical protein [Thermoanaerobaculia bacterium]